MINPYMQLAIDEARQGVQASAGGPFGCVIVKNGKVIASGHNEVILRNDPTSHGEMVTIRKASAALQTFDLTGCELYTTGEPCPMCMGAILWANIDKVYFGCNIHDAECIGFRDTVFYDMLADHGKLKHKVVELDRSACLELFEEYRQKECKTQY